MSRDADEMFFLMIGYEEFHDGDEWIGIYDSLPQLKVAYEKAARELEKEKERLGKDRFKLHEKVMIHIFNKDTEKWQYDVSYENFISLSDVPHTYDAYYVYGIGMIESEFYQIGKYNYAANGELKNRVLLKCMEIMLSEKPKSIHPIYPPSTGSPVQL